MLPLAHPPKLPGVTAHAFSDDERRAVYRAILERRDMREFDTSIGIHANWPVAFFATLVDGYLAQAGNTGGSVGSAPSRLFPARELLEFALPVMQRVAREPAGVRIAPGGLR